MQAETQAQPILAPENAVIGESVESKSKRGGSALAPAASRISRSVCSGAARVRRLLRRRARLTAGPCWWGS